MKKNILIVVFIYISSPLIIKSVPGVLDPTFGFGTGIVTTDVDGGLDGIEGIALQSDGKIVVAGLATVMGDDNFAVARYNPDGSLDTTFNPGGAVPGTVTTLIGTAGQARAVALQADGKIVAVGQALIVNNEFALARYNTDGSLDTSFNPTGPTPGTVTTAIGTGDTAHSVIIQADGRIVVAGEATVTNLDFALARYNPDGSLDTSFNPTGAQPGTVTTEVSIGSDVVRSVVIQPGDNKIVVGGQTDFGGSFKFALARYNTNGSLDTSFNSTGAVSGIPGIVITAIGIASGVLEIVLQPDGKIVAAGQAADGIINFATARYNPDGTLDTTFNGTGIVITDIGGQSSEGHAAALQVDGKIIVAGFAFTGANNDFALARYNTDGSLDVTFNPEGSQPGTVLTAIGIGDRALAVAIQADGKIIAGGDTVIGGIELFALARYLNDTLTITKEASSENPCPGQNITYTIRVSNFGGGGTVNEIYVTDVLPAELIFKSAQTRGAESSFDTATGVWFIPRLCVGEQAQLKVKARVGQFAGNQIICNTAITSYSSIDNITDSSLFDSLGISTTEIYSTTECVSTLPVLYENVNHIARRADCDLVDLNMNLCDLAEKINTLEVQQAINQVLTNKLLLKLDCILGF